MSTTGGAAHGAHGHNPYLAHHFDTMQQQFDSGKLGMWLFLVTEVLFFGGLFTAYAIFRANNHEMFHVGQYFLNWKLGGLNTVVLLISSFTAAYSVRAAQTNNQKGLLWSMALTFICAGIFMVIKYFEYTHKIHEGLVWGSSFNPTDGALQELYNASKEKGHAVYYTAAELGESGLRLGNFFSIYFCLTGLHGIHVLVGMGLYIWLIKRALKKDFNSKNYQAVDNVALYWHIVDMIWIFLFPLLYLIG